MALIRTDGMKTTYKSVIASTLCNNSLPNAPALPSGILKRLCEFALYRIDRAADM